MTMNEEQAMQIQGEVAVIESLQKEITQETARLEKFTDRILAKLSAVITLSGILTFLSFAFLPNSDKTSVIQFYLTWVFPYLVISIIFWVFTLKKSAATTMKELSVIHSEDPTVMVQYLRARLEVHDGVYKATNTIYQNTRKYFSFSLSFALAYMYLYILTFYLYIFDYLPSLREMILITFITLLLAHVFREWYLKPVVAIKISKEIKITGNTSQSTSTNGTTN